MARLAIVVLAVFWAIVTAGSLVWEVIDPASISSEQKPQALPSGLSGGGSGLSTHPTLAELTPDLRTSLREQIGDATAGPPNEPLRPPRAGAAVENPRASVDGGGEPASDQPAAQVSRSELPDTVRPRPRPEPPSVSAPNDVKGPEARPAMPGQRGDPRVTEAQSLLAALGYQIGTIDGRMGPQTRAAIKVYEKKSGLKVDGLVDDQLLARLRADTRSTSRESVPGAKASASPPEMQSFTGRVLGGVQRLIGHDFDSVTAPDKLMAYCDDRGDEWVYDRGLDRMRSCAEVVGKAAVAFRPLPGDR